MNELFYTESEKAGILNLLEVDVNNKTFHLTLAISADDVDYETTDFLSLSIFTALLKGLKVEGFKEI